jgi:excisionase family DNA binding protein
MITVEEAASRLYISPEECHRWIHAGVLPGVKVGQRCMVEETNVSRVMPAARARNPRNWLDHALTLMQAAEHLWPTAEGTTPAGGDTGTWAVGLMLAGRALEVLTKGLLIAKDPKLVSDDGLTKRIGHHKLDKLLNDCFKDEDAGFKLNAEDTAMVTRLKEFSIWAGCYPTNQTWTPRNPTPPIDTSDFFRCRQLFEQVRQRIEEVVRP